MPRSRSNRPPRPTSASDQLQAPLASLSLVDRLDPSSHSAANDRHSQAAVNPAAHPTVLPHTVKPKPRHTATTIPKNTVNTASLASTSGAPSAHSLDSGFEDSSNSPHARSSAGPSRSAPVLDLASKQPTVRTSNHPHPHPHPNQTHKKDRPVLRAKNTESRDVTDSTIVGRSSSQIKVKLTKQNQVMMHCTQLVELTSLATASVTSHSAPSQTRSLTSSASNQGKSRAHRSRSSHASRKPIPQVEADLADEIHRSIHQGFLAQVHSQLHPLADGRRALASEMNAYAIVGLRLT